MKFALIFLFSVCNVLILSAQKEGNIWYFGNNAGITFNTSPPSSLTDGKLSQREGCSSVCDKSGILLFYTDGQKVYDKTHTLMSNGSGLLGNNSSCQSGVIIPWPDSIYKYFIISVDAIENNATYGVRYSLVDMRLNGGKGDIVSGEKNIVLTKPQCEKATAVLHCNKKDFWLVTNQASSDSILSFAITSSGINKKAVRSNTGVTMSGNLNNNLGYINPSHDGTKLATCHFQLNKFLLMDFDNQTGKVSNVMTFSKTAAYCAEFSPNNKILYVSGLRSPTSIHQFDISSNNQSTIQSSKKQIFDYGSGEMGALKLASNGKIYASSETTTYGYNTYLGVINTPDSIGPYYNPTGIYLSGRNARLGLPNIFYSTPLLKNEVILVDDTCFGVIGTFNLVANNNSSTVKWDFGDPSSGSNNTATGVTVYHTFTAIGKYKVKAFYSYSCTYDTVIRLLNIINNNQKISLGKDTFVCPNTNTTLQPDIGGVGYLWSTGAKTKSIIVNKKGKYWVKVSFSCGASLDTIEIFDKVSKSDFNVPRDTLLCKKFINYPLIVSAKIAHQTLWNTGETRDTILISAPGNYIVNMQHICGTYTDTVNVSQFNIGAPLRDTGYCFPVTKTIVKQSVNSIKWNTGDTGHLLLINKAGQYSLIESYKHCSNYDTVDISDILKNAKYSFPKDSFFCQKFSNFPLIVSATVAHQTQWSTGETTDTINVSTPGNYTVSMTHYCGSYKDTIHISEFVIGTPLRDTSWCFPVTETLMKTSPNNVKWNTGDTTHAIQISQPGQYIATEYYKQCQHLDTIIITSKTNATAIFAGNDTVICSLPIAKTLSVSCVDGHTTLWSNGSTNDNISINSAGIYTVSVTNACQVFYDTVTVELFHSNLYLGRDTAYCFSTDYILTAPFYNNYQYRWQDGSKANTFAAKQKGSYYVTVGYGNCMTSDSINITGDNSADNVFIPNAFSPNDDDLNDFFPFQTSEKPIDIEIYNRWGEKIYAASKTTIGWNGLYKNKMVESDVYLYMIRYKDCSKRDVFLHGTFTVIY